MRVFVAGGTGYIGTALVRALVGAGHQVDALVRDDATAQRARSLGATPILGDLAEPRSLEHAARDHDALVHAAYLPGPSGASVDRAASFALIESARRARAPRLVVYTSGTWTLGRTGTTPADESSPTPLPAVVSEYRVALERDVLAAGGGELVTAVLRPGMVYGGGGGVAGWLADRLPSESRQPGHIVALGDGSNRWPVVHLDDLTRAYLAILEQRATGMFHAVEPAPILVAGLATRLAALARRPLAYWPIGPAAARLGPIVQAMTLDQHIVAPRSAAVLGWRPQRPPILEMLPEVWEEFVRASG